MVYCHFSEGDFLNLSIGLLNFTTILYTPTAQYTEEEIEYFTAQCVRPNLNHMTHSES